VKPPSIPGSCGERLDGERRVPVAIAALHVDPAERDARRHGEPAPEGTPRERQLAPRILLAVRRRGRRADVVVAEPEEVALGIELVGDA